MRDDTGKPHASAPGRPTGLLIDGERVRAYREARHLSRDDFAALASLTVKTLQRAELGGPVSTSTARELCRVMQVPIAALVRAHPDELQRRLEAHGRAPPRPPAHWVDREDELDELLTLLGFQRNGERLVPTHGAAAARSACITGAVGIGKSSLAQYAAALLAPIFPDGVVWVDAALASAEARLRVAQRDIAQALGFDAALPADGQASRREIDQAFRSQFWRRPRLLVIDDVIGDAYPDALLPESGEGVQGCVIMTSRLRHVARRWRVPMLELGPLDRAASREVLATCVEPQRLDADPHGLQRLLDLLEGNPRTLRIAGVALQRARLTTPSDYAQRVASAQASELGALAIYDELRPLVSAESWRVLAGLAVFGDAIFPAAWVAPLSAIDEARARLALSELIDVHLVHVADEGAMLYLRTHAATFARALAGEQLADAMSRLCEHVAAEMRAAALGRWDGAYRFLMRHRPIFERCLDHLLGPRARLPTIVEVDLPSELPAVVMAAGHARRLYELLASVDIYLLVRACEGAEWLALALAATRSAGLRTEHGRLLHYAAWWRAASHLGWHSGRSWFEAAISELEAGGDLAAAASSLESIGNTSFIVEPTGAFNVAHQERALALVRRARLEPLIVCHHLSHIGVLMTRRIGVPDAWSRGLALLEECQARAATLGPEAAWLRVTARVNAATIATIAGVTRDDGRDSAELEAALRALIAATADEDRLLRTALLAHGAHFGLAMGHASPEVALTEARRQWWEHTLEMRVDDAPPGFFFLQAVLIFLGVQDLDRREPNAAVVGGLGFFGLSSSEPRVPLPWLGGVSALLLLALEPLGGFIDEPYLELVDALAPHALVDGALLRRNVAALRASLARRSTITAATARSGR